MRFVGTGTRSAQPCHSARPATRAPSSGRCRRPRGARRRPRRLSVDPLVARRERERAAPRLTAKARTSTSASSGAGSGSGTSSRSSVRVGPRASRRQLAFTARYPSERRRRDQRAQPVELVRPMTKRSFRSSPPHAQAPADLRDWTMPRCSPSGATTQIPPPPEHHTLPSSSHSIPSGLPCPSPRPDAGDAAPARRRASRPRDVEHLDLCGESLTYRIRSSGEKHRPFGCSNSGVDDELGVAAARRHAEHTLEVQVARALPAERAAQRP